MGYKPYKYNFEINATAYLTQDYKGSLGVFTRDTEVTVIKRDRNNGAWIYQVKYIDADTNTTFVLQNVDEWMLSDKPLDLWDKVMIFLFGQY